MSSVNVTQFHRFQRFKFSDIIEPLYNINKNMPWSSQILIKTLILGIQCLKNSIHSKNEAQMATWKHIFINIRATQSFLIKGCIVL